MALENIWWNDIIKFKTGCNSEKADIIAKKQNNKEFLIQQKLQKKLQKIKIANLMKIKQAKEMQAKKKSEEIAEKINNEQEKQEEQEDQDERKEQRREQKKNRGRKEKKFRKRDTIYKHKEVHSLRERRKYRKLVEDGEKYSPVCRTSRDMEIRRIKVGRRKIKPKISRQDRIIQLINIDNSIDNIPDIPDVDEIVHYEEPEDIYLYNMGLL